MNLKCQFNKDQMLQVKNQETNERRIRLFKLDFQEKNLNLNRDLNHGYPDHQPGALNQVPGFFS